MKAERRHELKTNTLSRGLEALPEYARLYGNRVLLGLTLLLLIVWVIRYRIDTARASALQARVDVDSARRAVSELSNVEFWRLGTQEAVAGFRRQQAQVADDYINHALSIADHPATLAQAYLIRGDLDWKLANFPPLPGATTRPDQLGLPGRKNADDLLTEAEASYQQALHKAPAEDHLTAMTAHFGLAAIAENRREWEQAKKHYQAIADDPQVTAGLKDYAKGRMAELDDLRKSPLIAGPETQPSAPTTLPVAPTTLPTTRP